MNKRFLHALLLALILSLCAFARGTRSALAARPVTGSGLGSAPLTWRIFGTPGSFTITDAGNQTQVLTLGQYGTAGMPDTMFDYLKIGSSSFSATNTSSGSGVLWDSTDTITWTPHTTSGGNAVPFIIPSGAGNPDCNYAGPGEPYVGTDGKWYVAYHCENHQPPTMNNGQAWVNVCLMSMPAGGGSVTRLGSIITPAYASDPNTPAWGMGQGVLSLLSPPNDPYMYLFFSDFPNTTATFVVVTGCGAGAVPSQEGMGVARALKSSNGVPGSWTKWDGSAWTQPGIGGTFGLLLPLPLLTSGAANATIPNVKYNRHLGLYVMTYQSCNALRYSSSTDMVHWTDGGSYLSNANAPINYATQWSPGEDQGVTNSDLRVWYQNLTNGGQGVGKYWMWRKLTITP